MGALGSALEIKEKNKEKLSPVSGYELPYEPQEWKSNLEASCYAYALGTVLGSEFQGNNVGKLSGRDFSRKSIVSLVKSIYADVKSMGRTIKKVSFEEKCPKGTYKIALFVSPPRIYDGHYQEDTEFTDYHFYRQNPDGTWSHKMKDMEPSITDRAGNIITNPQAAQKMYSGENRGRDYTVFVGYFAISVNKKQNTQRNIIKNIINKTLGFKNK